MWAHPKRMIMCRTNYDGDLKCYVVLPMPSLKSARQRAKFENLSEGEKVRELARHLAAHFCRCSPDRIGGCEITAYSDAAAAALAVMEGRTL